MNIRTNVRTYIHTGQTLYPLHNFVVRGVNYLAIMGISLHVKMCGTRFPYDDELKAETKAWFEDQIEDFSFKGIGSLQKNRLGA